MYLDCFCREGVNFNCLVALLMVRQFSIENPQTKSCSIKKKITTTWLENLFTLTLTIGFSEGTRIEILMFLRVILNFGFKYQIQEELK